VPAAIDLGTNTVRLLIGQIHSGKVVPQRYHRAMTRLGGGFGEEQGLSLPARQRTLAALDECARILSQHGQPPVRIVATEILRRAPNADEFRQEVFRRTGLTVEVISGEQEARLSAKGALSAIDAGDGPDLIFDIGGGSTEFILVEYGSVLWHASFRLGVVELAEAAPSAATRREQIMQVVDRMLDELRGAQLLDRVLARPCRLIGTAGTVTSLAAMHLRMSEYDWRRVNGLRLTAVDLAALAEPIFSLDAAELEKYPGLEPGRGDLIKPGMEIVGSLLRRLHKTELLVSDFGLLEGVLLAGAEAAGAN
jgi:exopolyphosphatase / guanosine-5'-triphosphate,3'-diphosphate pyrophosphatase